MRVQGSGVSGFKYELRENEFAWYQMKGGFDQAPLTIDGVAEIILESGDELHGSVESEDTKKQRSPGLSPGSGGHDIVLTVKSVTSDSLEVLMAENSTRTPRKFIVGPREQESELRAQRENLSAQWQAKRREIAEARAKQDEERAIAKLFSEYPLQTPVNFELDAGWKDQLQSSAQKLAGKNETSAALASMDFFSDHIVWLTRTGEQTIEVWYRNNGPQHPLIKLTTKTQATSATGIVLECSGESPFGWRTLSLSLGKRTWEGSYAYALGRPPFELQISGASLFAIDIDKRPGRWLVKSLDSKFKFEGKKLGEGLVSLEMPEVHIGGATLYPEPNATLDTAVAAHRDGPLNSEIRLEGYWVDQPNIPNRTMRRRPGPADYWKAYYFRPRFVQDSFVYIEDVESAFSDYGPAEAVGVKRGMLMKNVDGKETAEMTKGEFDLAMFNSSYVEAQFVEPERQVALRTLPVPSNRQEKMSGVIGRGIIPFSGTPSVPRAVPVLDSDAPLPSQPKLTSQPLPNRNIGFMIDKMVRADSKVNTFGQHIADLVWPSIRQPAVATNILSGSQHGMMNDDQIEFINGKSTRSMSSEEIATAIANYGNGASLELKYLRWESDNSRYESFPLKRTTKIPDSTLSGVGLVLQYDVSECSFAKITDVVVGSPAQQAGLKAGDIVVGIGGKDTWLSLDKGAIALATDPLVEVKRQESAALRTLVDIIRGKYGTTVALRIVPLRVQVFR